MSGEKHGARSRQSREGGLSHGKKFVRVMAVHRHDFKRICGAALNLFFPCMSCMRSKNYQQLGQEEGVAGNSQWFADRVGRIMMQIAFLFFIGLFAHFIYSVSGVKNVDFDKKFPLVLFISTFELLVCGAAARTGAILYQISQHGHIHPSEPVVKGVYKVGPLRREKHLFEDDSEKKICPWGINYRISSDGVEVLIVEHIVTDSVVDKWNRGLNVGFEDEVIVSGTVFDGALKPIDSGCDTVVGRSILDDDDVNEFDVSDECNNEDGKKSRACKVSPRPQMQSGFTICAVNGIHGDVGNMQVELMKSDVITLWCRQTNDFHHVDDQEAGKVKCIMPRRGEEGEAISSDPRGENNEVDMETGDSLSLESTVDMKRFPAVALEDEPPQMFHRWSMFGCIFGWIASIPVLLVTPASERPRQQIFRSYLGNKFMLGLFSLWFIMWCLDVVAFCIQQGIIPPFCYFFVVHILLSTVIFVNVMRAQVEDERICLQQREQRKKQIPEENSCFVSEDPAPSALRELLISNPLAIAMIGLWCSVQILICQFCFPLKTKRGKLAQTYICILFAWIVPSQLVVLYIASKLQFRNMNHVYLVSFVLPIFFPFFILWCICLLCSSQYAKADLNLCRAQRESQAIQLSAKNGRTFKEGEKSDGSKLTEIRETEYRDWEMVNSC